MILILIFKDNIKAIEAIQKWLSQFQLSCEIILFSSVTSPNIEEFLVIRFLNLMTLGASGHQDILKQLLN